MMETYRWLLSVAAWHLPPPFYATSVTRMSYSRTCTLDSSKGRTATHQWMSDSVTDERSYFTYNSVQTSNRGTIANTAVRTGSHIYCLPVFLGDNGSTAVPVLYWNTSVPVLVYSILSMSCTVRRIAETDIKRVVNCNSDRTGNNKSCTIEIGSEGKSNLTRRTSWI